MLAKYKYIFPVFLPAILLGCSKKEAEVLPAVSVMSNITVTEGDNGIKTATFNVSVSGEFSEAGNPSVSYSIRHLSTTDSDIKTLSGTLEFTFAGEVKTIQVEILGDKIYEPNKQFELRISDEVNARIISSGRSKTGELIDNDPCFPGDCEGYINSTTYEGMTLAWSDEFDGTTINSDIWEHDLGGGGWWNAQLQEFTASSQNSFLENGELVLKVMKQGQQYTSAQLKTQGKKFVNTGRLDIRAKFPGGKGIWPRLWLKPEQNVHGNWPQSGEIVMAEMYGHSPNIAHTLVDYGKDGNDMERHPFSYVSEQHNSFSDVYHTYSLIWESGKISMLIDEHQYMTLTKTEVQALGYTYPYDADFHLILSMAVGGTKVGDPDDAILPKEIRIDYVRFYSAN